MIEVLEKNKAVRRLCYAVLLVILMFALQPVLVRRKIVKGMTWES